MIKPETKIVDLGFARPGQARLLLAQCRWDRDDWVSRDGLVFLRNIEAARDFLERSLTKARQAACDLVLLPELSVPEECVGIAQEWSRLTGSIVIAGSHYFKGRLGYIARSPVIIAGSIHFVEKIIPAPIEVSPIIGEGLQAGKNLYIFRNTSVGTFAVLICSDYLERPLVDLLILDQLDLLCVLAFQRVSNEYHVRMNIDCEEQIDGLYVAYANNVCPSHGDGRSALFALMDDIFSAKLRDAGFSDLQPSCKVLEFREQHTYAVVDVDLHFKRPLQKRTVHSKPNVYIVAVESRSDAVTEKFASSIGRADARYARITDFYIPPREYDDILRLLERKHLIFITGDPGLGKTYTAVRVLRHYFDLGYDPIWFGGLEKAERLNQRQILDNFEPQPRQIVYFEDPFGRTVFEKRDTVRRTIGPLLDRLSDLDARVIITSRQEIFEQFSHESLSLTDLSSFTQELNVIKPSYPVQALEQILDRHARHATWHNDETCRTTVTAEITKGKLASPLAIRDFAFSTAHVSDIGVLLDRVNKWDREQNLLFAEDIASSNQPTKILLSFVFIAGHQSLATLTAWFNQTASIVSPDSTWDGTAPFFGVLRRQLEYRIESYGIRANILRFSHAYYDEAFAAAAANDAETSAILQTVIKLLGRISSWSAINGVARQARKYPRLGLDLSRELMSVIVHSGKLFDLCQLASECLDRRGKGNLFIEYLRLVQEFLPIRNLFKAINDEADMTSLSHALRLGLNYKRELMNFGLLKRDDWVSVAGLINWERLYNLWRSEANWGTSIDAFKWATYIDRHQVTAFFRSLKEGELYPKILSLTLRQQERLLRVMPPTRFRDRLTSMIGAHLGSTKYSELAELYGNNALVNSIGLIIDEGALTALRNGLNLLPIGICEVLGEFERLDVISILQEKEGKRIAIGITEYGSQELRKIMGLHSRMIDDKLGYSYGRAVLRGSRIAFVSSSDRPEGA